MTVSPPASPTGAPPRPISAVMRTPRSSSRLSMSSRPGGSRASDEDGKTAVKVGMCGFSPDRIPWLPSPATTKRPHISSPQPNQLTDLAQLSVCDRH